MIQPGGRRTPPPRHIRVGLAQSTDMDHRIEWIAARQQELANAATWELWAALCFVTGACILLALYMWWYDPY